MPSRVDISLYISLAMVKVGGGKSSGSQSDRLKGFSWVRYVSCYTVLHFLQLHGCGFIQTSISQRKHTKEPSTR